MTISKKLLAALCALCLPLFLTAQTGGFGRNKPHYERFDFEVYQSPHFELYTYINNDAWLRGFLNDSEEWYRVHQRVLNDTIRFKNPMIIYGNHPDFQQTNAINGAISTGTGGVTEAFKNRVILPIANTNQQTHHVLGHELVHAFQYNMVIRGDSTNLRDLQKLPLWMVEGLAEYLSIGSVDPFTAMWMRDAVLNDDVPSIKELNGNKYFPYRYGQAFWAFVTGLKGDDIIAPYFRSTAKFGLETSTQLVMGMKLEQLSELWEGSLRKTYAPYVDGATQDRLVGKALVSRERNGGKINVAPEISPNGKYLIYLSEKDLFSIDLFLADARTGKTIRKIRSTAKGDHVDELSYIENSGTWSPDSKRFAYVAVSKGDNVLVIADVDRGKTSRSIRLAGVPAFSSPAWSPDGKSIVVAGLVEGQSDLYALDLRNEGVTQLTDDAYSETHPAWSADGATLYFSTDRVSMATAHRPHGALRFNLAKLDVASGAVTDLPVFPGADNLNPVEGADGQLYFLSNRDGFRNIYRYDPGQDSVARVTDLITGVSGITHYAPAMSMDRRNKRLVYTYFSQQGYRIHSVLTDQLAVTPVDKNAVDLSPASLPRLNRAVVSTVDAQLRQMDAGPVISDEDIQHREYRPKFKLDHISGGAGAGVGTNQIIGTNVGAQGGVQAIFSDVLGDNQLFGTAVLNGELTDFGANVGYLNRKHRILYGASIGRTPFRTFGALAPRIEELPVGDDAFIEVGNAPYLIRRIYQNQLTGFAQVPLTTRFRLEASLGASLYSERVDQYNRYFDPATGFPINVGQGLQRPDRQEELEGPSFSLFTAGVAAVGDNATFGLTSPIKGYRYRLGVDRYLGAFDFTNVTADYRKYFWLKKAALAFRGLHQGRYGGNGDELFPLFVGSPWYMRGLTGNDLFNELFEAGRNPNELFGSKLFVANAELRIPFTGPKRLALIKSGILLSDINFFVDAGFAFNSFEQFGGEQFTLDAEGNPLIDPTTGEPFVAVPGIRPLITAGVSTRINVFGQLVVEPFVARPLIEGGTWRFGLNLQPGW